MTTQPRPSSPGFASDWSGQKLGEFHLLRRLGQGGMGTVYLAEQPSLRRRVAVKVLRNDTAATENARKRFRAEAEAVARLNHANIVQLYQFHDESLPHYMVLEYVEGWNLREYLARKGPPDLPLALSIMWQVASALQRAAELGIVHRDIKPENILLTRKNEVKIADFGLSRMLDSQAQTQQLTQTGVTMGTPMYMSPEQVEGRPTDHRSDIYSFGVTCYHLLTGQPPFEGQNAFAVALQHIQKDPLPLESLRPDLPPQLCRLVHRMLAKNPEDRPQSAAEILQELQSLSEQVSPKSGATTPIRLASLPEISLPTLVVADPPADRRPTRQPLWRWALLGLVVAGSLIISSIAGMMVGKTFQPSADPAAPETFETPPAAPLETLLGSYQRKERGYRDLIEETENPGKDREELRRGVQHRMDLGLLYLEQVPRDLQRAEELFAAQMKSKIREYEHVGKVGMAMVLAFRDQPEKSNELFLEVLTQPREGGLVLPPNLRWLRMLLTALEHNKRNCQALKLRYPPELLMFEAGLRRIPGTLPGFSGNGLGDRPAAK
jgi:serine/threonine protein kinase